MLHVSGMSIEINKWEHSNYESETSTALVLAIAMLWGGVGGHWQVKDAQGILNRGGCQTEYILKPPIIT